MVAWAGGETEELGKTGCREVSSRRQNLHNLGVSWIWEGGGVKVSLPGDSLDPGLKMDGGATS